MEKNVIIFSTSLETDSKLFSEIKTELARVELNRMGIFFKEVVGQYNGTIETSFVVGIKHLKEALKIAQSNYQESILVVDAESQAKLVFLEDDSKVYIGKFKMVDSDTALALNNYTFDPQTKTHWVTV